MTHEFLFHTLVVRLFYLKFNNFIINCSGQVCQTETTESRKSTIKALKSLCVQNRYRNRSNKGLEALKYEMWYRILEWINIGKFMECTFDWSTFGILNKYDECSCSCTESKQWGRMRKVKVSNEEREGRWKKGVREGCKEGERYERVGGGKWVAEIQRKNVGSGKELREDYSKLWMSEKDGDWMVRGNN